MRSVKQARELKLIDPGPWDNESDSKFDFIYKSYRCFGKRNGRLAWCGYIEGKFNYEEMAILEKEFHGGITYDTFAVYSDNHVLLFYCDHIDDLSPINHNLVYSNRGTYRTEDYVKSVLKNSIDAIVAIKKKKDFKRNLGKL